MRECLEIRLAEVPSAEVEWGVFVCIYLDSARCGWHHSLGGGSWTV